MALIAGTVPPRDPRFSSSPRNVVVKLGRGSDHISTLIAAIASQTPDAIDTVLGLLFGSHWNQFDHHGSHFTIQPYLEPAHEELLRATATAQSSGSRDLAATGPRYLVVECPTDVAPARVADV